MPQSWSLRLLAYEMGKCEEEAEILESLVQGTTVRQLLGF